VGRGGGAKTGEKRKRGDQPARAVRLTKYELVLGATQRHTATTSAHAQIWALLKWGRPSHTYLTGVSGKLILDIGVLQYGGKVRKKETDQISRIWYCKTDATFRCVRSDGLSGFPGVFMC
jgi:hypothetical protein